MGTGVTDGEEQHGVGNLPVEPLRLIQRKPSDLGPNHSKNVPAHREDNAHGVDRQDQTRTTRDPDGVLQSIEGGETDIASLLPPDCVLAMIKSQSATKTYHP